MSVDAIGVNATIAIPSRCSLQVYWLAAPQNLTKVCEVFLLPKPYLYYFRNAIGVSATIAIPSLRSLQESKDKSSACIWNCRAKLHSRLPRALPLQHRCVAKQRQTCVDKSVNSSIKSHERIVGFLLPKIVAQRLLCLVAKAIVFGWRTCLWLKVVAEDIELFAGILFVILDTIRVFYFV